MNSKRESVFKFSDLNDKCSKRISNLTLKHANLDNEESFHDLKFLNSKPRTSNQYIREGIPKFSLIRKSKDSYVSINKRFSDNIAYSKSQINDSHVRFKTTNIKKIVTKKINPSIERFKTNVKEVCSGIINLM